MPPMPPVVLLYVVDPLERAARTFAQQFVLALTAGGGAVLLTQSWQLAADSAGLAALVSILTSVLTFKVPHLPAWADLLLRVVKTGLQSFLGTLIASSALSLTQVDWQGALALAIKVAGAAAVIGIAALGVPATIGASLLPAGITAAVEDPEIADAEQTNVGIPADRQEVFEPYDPHAQFEDASRS